MKATFDRSDYSTFATTTSAWPLLARGFEESIESCRTSSPRGDALDLALREGWLIQGLTRGRYDLSDRK